MTLTADGRKPPERRLHPLRAEIVRGFAPWTGAAVLLTLGMLLTGTSAQWQGGWAETRSQLHDSMLVIAPLTAAAGCLQGGRERRRRTDELWETAVRGRLARFLASAMPVALWAAAGFTAAAALALLATWPYAQGDRPHLGLLPGDAVLLAACAMAGHVVGRLVAWRPAAPALAMAGYVGLAVPAMASPGAGRHLDAAFPAPVGSYPVWWQPVVMAVWTGGLASAAVLAYAARRRYTALVPLAAAIAAGALLVRTGDGLWHDDPLASRQVCDTSTTPQICVNARYEGLLPQVREALSEVVGRLEGVQNLPVRFEDRPTAPRHGEAQLPMLAPLGWSVVRGRLTDPKQYAWEAVAELEGRGDCQSTLDPRVRRADDAVEHYLAPGPHQEYFDRLAAEGSAAERAELTARQRARARLASMGEEERRIWLSAYFATAGSCGARAVPAL
ncbi:hypothetical protein ACFYYI_08285 [Streptomyces sp. NPDC002387]|uniref:hypothetical protein n=1 Tax=unclassified Streptomyces TaxID=2593676 RepID=UPI0036CC9036